MAEPHNGPNGGQIQQIVKSIVDTTTERDALREEVRRLKGELHDYSSRIDFIVRELKRVTAEKDFYQRHSISVHTRLSDINMLITQAIDEAQQNAYRAGEPPSLEQLRDQQPEQT